MSKVHELFSALALNDDDASTTKGTDEVVFLLINSKSSMHERKLMKFYEALIHAFFDSDSVHVSKTRDIDQSIINRWIPQLSSSSNVGDKDENDRLLINLISEGNNGVSTFRLNDDKRSIIIKSLIDKSIKIQNGSELKDRIERFCLMFEINDPRSELNYHDAFVLCTPLPPSSTSSTSSTPTPTTTTSRPTMSTGPANAPVVITRCRFCNKPLDVISVNQHESSECLDYIVTDPSMPTGTKALPKRVIVLIAIGDEGKERASIFRNAFALANASVNDDDTFFLTTFDVPVLSKTRAMHNYLIQVMKQSILTAIPSETIRQAVVFCNQRFINNGINLIQFHDSSIRIDAVHYNVLLNPKDSVGKGAMGFHEIDYEAEKWKFRLMGKYFGTMFVFVERSSFVVNLLWSINSLKTRYLKENLKAIPQYVSTPFKLSD